VLERAGDAIRFNPELLKFAAHHGFEPRPVGIARSSATAPQRAGHTELPHEHWRSST
jgi:hypothetical protein